MRKSQLSLISYIFITLMSIVAIFFLINVFSSFFEDPYNSKIRDIHMNSIYTFIKDSDEIYTRGNLNKECYFMLNLHSILDTQKNENILRGFIIRDNGIYKHDYNIEEEVDKRYPSTFKTLDVNIKKDDTKKTLLSFFNSKNIKIAEASYLKFIPKDNRYQIILFMDNKQVDLLDDNIEEKTKLTNEDLGNWFGNEIDLYSSDESIFLKEATEIKSKSELDYDNFFLAYNPKNKNLFVTQNELTNFFINENHCIREKTIYDLKSDLSENITSIFDNYMSVRDSRVNCEYDLFLKGIHHKDIFKLNDLCDKFSKEEKEIEEEIDFIMKDIFSSNLISSRDDFYENLEKFEDLKFNLLNSLKLIKNDCEAITNNLKIQDQSRIDDFWESTCNNLNNTKNILENLEKDTQAHSELKKMYELSKISCENDDLKETIFPQLYQEEKIPCSLEKIEEFENFYLKNFSFQSQNYENYREEFYYYLNNTKNDYYPCSNSNSKGCNLLIDQFEFYKKYISLMGSNDYEIFMSKIFADLELLREFYSVEK